MNLKTHSERIVFVVRKFVRFARCELEMTQLTLAFITFFFFHSYFITNYRKKDTFFVICDEARQEGWKLRKARRTHSDNPWSVIGWIWGEKKKKKRRWSCACRVRRANWTNHRFSHDNLILVRHPDDFLRCHFTLKSDKFQRLFFFVLWFRG